MNDGLRLRLSDDQQRRLVRGPTTDGDAYDLYLQSVYLQRRATEEDYLYSRELLERAVARDPDFARALAALSGNYGMMATNGFERPTVAWPLVSRYMRQALEIDQILGTGRQPQREGQVDDGSERGGDAKRPLPSEAVVRTRLVAGLVAVTAAPERTPPVSS